MRWFNKKEFVMVVSILAFITIMSLFNFRISLRRARDSQRRSDIGSIARALAEYHQDFGFFPPATQDGRIKACLKGDNFKSMVGRDDEEEGLGLQAYFTQLQACEWGKDPLKDVTGQVEVDYLKIIPMDPKFDRGITYLYLSSVDRFQLFAYLEGEISEDQYNGGVYSRNLLCGKKVCNFGKAHAETPLNLSIEEYEEGLKMLEMK